MVRCAHSIAWHAQASGQHQTVVVCALSPEYEGSQCIVVVIAVTCGTFSVEVVLHVLSVTSSALYLRCLLRQTLSGCMWCLGG